METQEWEVVSSHTADEYSDIASEQSYSNEDVVFLEQEIKNVVNASVVVSPLESMPVDSEFDSNCWSCPKCTLDNEMNSRVCIACEYTMPSTDRDRDVYYNSDEPATPPSFHNSSDRKAFATDMDDSPSLGRIRSRARTVRSQTKSRVKEFHLTLPQTVARLKSQNNIDKANNRERFFWYNGKAEFGDVETVREMLNESGWVPSRKSMWKTATKNFKQGRQLVAQLGSSDSSQLGANAAYLFATQIARFCRNNASKRTLALTHRIELLPISEDQLHSLGIDCEVLLAKDELNLFMGFDTQDLNGCYTVYIGVDESRRKPTARMRYGSIAVFKLVPETTPAAHVSSKPEFFEDRLTSEKYKRLKEKVKRSQRQVEFDYLS